MKLSNLIYYICSPILRSRWYRYTTISISFKISNENFVLKPIVDSSKDVERKGAKDIMTLKLAVAIGRFNLIIRDDVYILQATREVLGHDVDQFSINWSTYQRARWNIIKNRAKKINIKSIQHFVALHFYVP